MVVARMKKAHIKIGGIVAIVIGFFMLLGLSFESSEVLGVNVTTKATVTNAQPTVYLIVVTPDPISLTAGTTTEISCNGSVNDFDGTGDIAAVNATLYRFSVDSDAADDNNNHYTNNSCGTSACATISSQNASCECKFNVEYYADNATWACNLTVRDSGNLNTSLNDTVELQTLIAIGLPNEIDFGNVGLSETSQNITANITNFGNVIVNSSVRGFGGTSNISNANLSMNCTIGSIPIQNMKYDTVTDEPFATMNEINSTDRPVVNFTSAVRQNDAAADDSYNITYWRLQMPSSGVAGVCNGTLVFTATSGT